PRRLRSNGRERREGYERRRSAALTVPAVVVIAADAVVDVAAHFAAVVRLVAGETVDELVALETAAGRHVEVLRLRGAVHDPELLVVAEIEIRPVALGGVVRQVGAVDLVDVRDLARLLVVGRDLARRRRFLARLRRPGSALLRVLRDGALSF